MLTRLAAFLCALGLATSLSAQSLPLDSLTPPLPSKGARMTADVISWGLVGAALILDTRASWRSKDRPYALKLQATRIGLTYGFAALAKGLAARERPCAPACGIDSPDSSFYSMHTAFAFQTLGGPRFAVSIPLAVGTGGLRIAAGKHWLTDTLVGAGAGALISTIRPVN